MGCWSDWPSLPPQDPMTSFIDLILPRTDAGVLAQVVAVVVIGAVAVVATRSRRDWRLVALGSTLFALALMGLRALH